MGTNNTAALNSHRRRGASIISEAAPWCATLVPSLLLACVAVITGCNSILGIEKPRRREEQSSATAGDAEPQSSTLLHFSGAVAVPSASHEILFELDTTTGAINGVTTWPADPDRNLPERHFVLIGTVDTDGRIRAQDNTPELIPGYNRGIYTGSFQQDSNVISGKYFERNPATGEEAYEGDWLATRS